MNQLISARVAWGFTGASMAVFAAWVALTMALWQLPFHPWNSIALAAACFVTFYAWSAIKPKTLLLVRRSIGIWEVVTFLAIVLAAIFGPAGQPFPRFALAMIVVPGGIVAVIIALCGVINLVRSAFAGFSHPTCFHAADATDVVPKASDVVAETMRETHRFS